MRSSRCSNITLISMRARLAPRQKWGPPPPKAMCGLGVASDVELVGIFEDVCVPVRRDVEEDHLLVLAYLLAADLDGCGGLTPEVHDRGDEAEHLLCRRRQKRRGRRRSRCHWSG